MDQEKVWDEIAPSWNKFRTRTVKEVEEFFDGKVGKVLDLGCGSGRNFIEKKDLEFYGVDFSSKLLEFAEEKGYIELKKCATDKISYGDGLFDFVIFVKTLHCVEGKEKRKKSFEEIYRVLKKNGEVLVSTIGRGNKRVKNRPKEGFLPWTVEEKKYERYTYIYNLDELAGLVESVGFKVLKKWEDKNVWLVLKK